MAKIRVILADDHTVMREGTRRILDEQPDLQVVAEAADGEETVQLARDLRPDIVVLDINMPRLNGIEATEAILRNVPSPKILVLTGYDNQQYVEALVRAGVDGYLLKSASSGELIAALRAVYAGQRAFQPDMADRVRAIEAQGPDQDKPTDREREVLRLVALGLRNPQISERLCTSQRAVEWHLTNLFDKFKVESRTDLVRQARLKGWVID